ncbi:MAG: hypothetical protein ACTSX7_03400 [Alphaproteobacteria bacterium]
MTLQQGKSRERLVRFLFGFLVGIIFAIPLALIIAACLIIFLGGLKDFQPIIGSILALFAAVLTIFFINRQITQTDRHAKEQRRRRNASARAVMPLELSTLCTYAEQCAMFLAELYPAPNEDGNIRAPEGWSTTVPVVAPEAVSVLRECIEFADEAIAHVIEDLLVKLQVQGSRLQGVRADLLGTSATSSAARISRMDLDTYIVDAIEVYACAALLFEYARRETDEAPRAPNLKDMATAAKLSGIRNHRFPRIHEILERRYQ